MACSVSAGIIACPTTSTSIATITSLVVTTFESVFTTTKQIVTTFQATAGETVTITPPLPPWRIDPSISDAATSVSTISSFPATLTPTNTVPAGTTYTSSTTSTIFGPVATVTEIVVCLQDIHGNAFTTTTLTLSAATTTYSSPIPVTPLAVVVGQSPGGDWNTWSDAEKGGLIAGCVVMFLSLVFLFLYWCLRRRTIWIANNWSVNSHPGVVFGHSHYGYGTSYPWMRGGGEHSFNKGKTHFNGWYRRDEGGEKELHVDSRSQGKPGMSRDDRPAFYQPPATGSNA